MKRIAVLLIALLALLVFVGCGQNKNPAEEELPKMASDREVLKTWDQYVMLEGVPRFDGTGIFGGVEAGEEEAVTLTYFGVDADSFVGYTEKLKDSGFTLAKGSEIWVAEGLSGCPAFLRCEKQVSLVWSINGVLMISVEE